MIELPTVSEDGSGRDYAERHLRQRADPSFPVGVRPRDDGLEDARHRHFQPGPLRYTVEHYRARVRDRRLPA